MASFSYLRGVTMSVFILKCRLKIMYGLLLLVAALLFGFVKTREHFSLGGQEIVNINFPGLGKEDTCPRARPDKNDGLCYPNCRSGYHGVGPVCWADTENIGVGTPVGLEPCPDGWVTAGLICRNPIRCDPIDTHGTWMPWKWTGGGCRGGEVVGRLNKGGVCPGPGGGNDHKDKIDGLCYRKCENKARPTHLPGMPYLCYAGGDLSYGRGAGTIPSIVRIAGRFNPF